MISRNPSFVISRREFSMRAAPGCGETFRVNSRVPLSFLEVCEKRRPGHDPRNHTKFHEIRRANLVFISCGFLAPHAGRVLVFLFQQPGRRHHLRQEPGPMTKLNQYQITIWPSGPHLPASLRTFFYALRPVPFVNFQFDALNFTCFRMVLSGSS